MPHSKNSGKEKITTLSEIISLQSNLSEWQTTSVSDGKQNKHLTVNSNRLLVLVSCLDGETQRFVPATSREKILHICQYSLFADTMGSVAGKTRWGRCTTSPISSMTSTLESVIVAPADIIGHTVGNHGSSNFFLVWTFHLYLNGLT